MRETDAWTPFSWHCPNCGVIVTGYKNQNGDIKVECTRCRVVMVRKIRNKAHDTIDVFANKNQKGRAIQ